MKQMKPETEIRIVLCIGFLFGTVFGFACGALYFRVPALQVTVQAPPAPIIFVSPAEYADGVIVRNGDLEQNTFTSTVASCTVLRPKPQDMKLRYMNGERIK